MNRLVRNDHGAAAVEFALALPPFLIMLLGAVQLAIIASASTGLQYALDEGARYASVHPAPSDEQIIDRVKSRRLGLDPAYTSTPTISHATRYGVPYIDITPQPNLRGRDSSDARIISALLIIYIYHLLIVPS